MQELIAMDQGEGYSGNCMHLTFDDGLREVYDIIVPILQKKGIPASFFINPAFIDNKQLFYRFKCSILAHPLYIGRVPSSIRKDLSVVLGTHSLHPHALAGSILRLRPDDELRIERIARLLKIDFTVYLHDEKPYLSLNQLRKIDSLGFTLGAHGMGHKLFSELTMEDQLKEAIDSLNWITANFPAQPRVFAFPFTDEGVMGSFFTRLQQAAVPPLDLSFGTAGLKKDSAAKHLQRIPVEKGNLAAPRTVFAEYVYYSSALNQGSTWKYLRKSKSHVSVFRGMMLL
jgi:peptidoglycan/xylan/chitin deacetylase (PgdA/CDA1 family)